MSDYIKQLESRVELLQNTLEERYDLSSTAEIMKAIIEEKKIQLTTVSNIKFTISDAFSICSVVYSSGRRSGKTTAISKLHKKYNSAVIMLNSINTFARYGADYSIGSFDAVGRASVYNEVIFVDDYFEHLKSNSRSIEQLKIKLDAYLCKVPSDKLPVILLT